MTDAVATDESAIQVSLLTGFLGSGKTTLLNHLLQHADMSESAVLVNEFGDVGIDHLLVEQVDEEIVQLTTGCLCCTIQGDLTRALRELFLKRAKGDITQFRRVLIETTGLADPAPVLHTLINDPIIATRYYLDRVDRRLRIEHQDGGPCVQSFGFVGLPPFRGLRVPCKGTDGNRQWHGVNGQHRDPPRWGTTR